MLRDSFSLRYTARGRPVISQRLRTRILAELRGSSASFSTASKRSSGDASLFLIAAFSLERLAAYCAESFSRRLFFSTELVFAISAILSRLSSVTAFVNRPGEPWLPIYLKSVGWGTCVSVLFLYGGVRSIKN